MPHGSCAATLQERLERLPGDELVPDPAICATHAVCIAAPPDRVWPWLAQMGGGRAGWYSHDWVDNGGAPSAERIVPALQRLEPGDVLPALPGANDGFLVADVDAPRRIVLAWPSREDGSSASWTFVLRETARGDTRLLVRTRVTREALRTGRSGAGEPRAFVERIYRALPHLPLPVLRAMAAVGHGFMQAAQLRGIKHRAELHRRS